MLVNMSQNVANPVDLFFWIFEISFDIEMFRNRMKVLKITRNLQHVCMTRKYKRVRTQGSLRTVIAFVLVLFDDFSFIKRLISEMFYKTLSWSFFLISTLTPAALRA